MKHARDTVNIWQIVANVIKNIMDRGVNTLTNVLATMIAVIKENALIYKVHRCRDANAFVISDGLDQTAQKVSSYTTLQTVVRKRMLIVTIMI